MFYILIPIILVIIFFLKKGKINEKFSNPPSTLENELKSEFLTKVVNKDYKIEILEINPFFKKEILQVDRDLNPDGSQNFTIPYLKENIEWKNDFQKRLCIGCACTKPKKYCVKKNNLDFKLNQSTLEVPTPSPSFTEPPSHSINPYPSLSNEPVPSPSIVPTPSIEPSASPSLEPVPSPSLEPVPSPSIVPSPSTEPYPSPSMEPVPSPSIEPFTSYSRDNPSHSPVPSYSPSVDSVSSNCGKGYEEKELTICGYTENNKEYQCSQKCPECNLCHLEMNGIQNNYKNNCGEVKDATDRELCEFLRGRVKHVKDKCIFPYDIKNVELNNKECYSFKLKRDNRIVPNDKIIFRITTSEKTNNFKLNKIFYMVKGKRKIITPINFFSDTKEHYFYFKTNNLKDFKDDIIINMIFSINEERYQETLKIFVINLQSYLPRYHESIGHTTEKEPCVLPSTFDDYNLNYLEESEPSTEKLVNGYSYKNKVKEYAIGDYKEYTYKDEPNTWKLRSDINRPWISVG